MSPHANPHDSRDRRWSDRRPPRTDGRAPCAHPAGSLLERIHAQGVRPEGPSAAARFLAEAERQLAPLATDLARLGLDLRPVTSCGTLWRLHSTITGRPVSPAMTAFWIRQAIAGLSLD